MDNSVAEIVSAFNRDSSTENVYDKTVTMSENKRDGWSKNIYFNWMVF